MKNVIELVAMEKTYSGRELAEMLGVGASTLRKWSMLLEQQGYWFQRDNQNRREYRGADVTALRRFYHLTKEQMTPLEDAARIIAGQASPEMAKRGAAAAISLAPPPVSTAHPTPHQTSHQAYQQPYQANTHPSPFPASEISPTLAQRPSPHPAAVESANTAAALALRTSSHVDALEEKLLALAQHVQQQDSVQTALMEQLEQQGAYIRTSLKERDRRLTSAMNEIFEMKKQLARLQDKQRKTSIWHRLFRID